MSGFELGTDGPSRILLGIDESETSMRAGAYAAGLARRQGAQLIALYVASTTGIAAGMAATAGAMIQTHASVAADLRAMIEEGALRIGIRTQFIVRKGNPYAELVRVADEVKADAIVVGASMQSGHKLVGSLAGRLVRDARWPVTVVP
jgi:nucleotide-binding universal stress UspA family protein